MIGELNMGAAERLRAIAKDKKILVANMASHMGLAPQTLYNKMTRNTMKYNEVEDLAEYLGCEIIFRDKETGKEY